MLARVFAVCALAGFAVAGEPDLPPILELLKSVQERVSANYARMPNYVCGQTVERFERPRKHKKYDALDTLRLEVALIGGRELYAWPGSSKFDDRPLDAMLKSGASGSGSYAIHPRNLFLSSGGRFVLRGREELNGIATYRLDFTVPLVTSRFTIANGPQHAVVGYHGSVWVDARSRELVRLHTVADAIPLLDVLGSEDTIDYQRVKIGAGEFTLPKTVELRMTATDVEFRNLTRFEGCRQYVGESVVRFDDAPAASPAAGPQQITLPPGLAAITALDSPISSDGKLAIGDPVTALLIRPIEQKDHVYFPKGAKLTGHLTRLERRHSPILDFFLVGVVFDSIESAGAQAVFTAKLEDAGITSNGSFFVPLDSSPHPRSVWSGIRLETAPPEPNEGIFCVKGGKLSVLRGTRLVWRTTAPGEK